MEALDAIAFVKSLMRDPDIMKVILDHEDETLDVKKVAKLLDCSPRTLEREMEAGTWFMAIGPNGKKQMTRQQFREQQRLRLKVKK